MIRYTERPFPAYRFVPGVNPHPRRDPRGHSYASSEAKPEPVESHRWSESQDYLYGVDLFNFGYWWESHEAWEGLWHACGHGSAEARFLQGLIFIAAGQLKRLMASGGGQTHAHKAVGRLREYPARYMGIDVSDLVMQTQNRFADRKEDSIRLDLHFQ